MRCKLQGVWSSGPLDLTPALAVPAPSESHTRLAWLLDLSGGSSVSFPAELKLLRGLCLVCTLSEIVSFGHLPPSHCGRVTPETPKYVVLLLSLQTINPFSEWLLMKPSQLWREMRCISSPTPPGRVDKSLSEQNPQHVCSSQ